MKVIIAGSRNFTDKKRIFEFINKSGFKITEVVSGGADGVDKIGEEWAELKGIPVKRFIQHYSIDAKVSPQIINTDMGAYADALIAIWLNKSRGTEHMIKVMKKNKKPIEIIELLPEITGDNNIRKRAP